MLETWRLALRNLRRNRRRNFATGAAIAVGFAALLALGGYTFRAMNFLRVHAIFVKQAGHLVVYKKGGLDHFAAKPAEYSIPAAMQEKIAAILSKEANVDFFGGQLTGSGLVGNGCKSLPFIINGLSPAIDRLLREHPQMLRWTPQFAAYSKGRGLWNYQDDLGAIALSEGLAHLLGKPKVLDDLAPDTPLAAIDCASPSVSSDIASDANVQLMGATWNSELTAFDGEVVAHYSTGLSETNSSAIFTSLSYLQKFYGTENVTFMSIWLKDPTAIADTFKNVEAQLASAGIDSELYRWDDERISPMYTGTVDFLLTMVLFISFILAVIIIFSVFNATTITIIERTQEIGMMRSLGFTRSQLRRLYMQEACLLTLLAIFAGGFFGGLAIFAVNSAKIMFHPPGIAGGMHLLLTPNFVICLVSGLGIFILALLTTYCAMFSAARRPIPLLLSGALR